MSEYIHRERMREALSLVEKDRRGKFGGGYAYPQELIEEIIAETESVPRGTPQIDIVENAILLFERNRFHVRA